MAKKINHRLRVERATWTFTQKEMAPLLLIRHRTQLCRLERGFRNPSIATVVAACAIFDKSIDELFPGLRAVVFDQVARNAYRLYLQLERDKSPSGDRKRQLLRKIISSKSLAC